MGEGVADAWERLREKLIDLTANNRLLNFRHGSGTTGSQSVLRVADELPDLLWDRLIAGKPLVVDAIQEPSARELEEFHRARRGDMPGLESEEARARLRPRDAVDWARWLDRAGERHLTYDLPLDVDERERPARFNDNKVSTLLYADQLETRLRRLRSNARTALEETGSNLLFLAFGFLEWTDKPARFGQAGDGKSYIAPLLLMPVAIDAETTGRGVRRYTLSWSGEDIQTNLSLERKLKQDFDLPLPARAEDEGPEAYMARVAQATGGQPDWRVRRYVTLALLTNLGKLLLYLDLDPAKWPESGKPSVHPIVRSVLGAGDSAPRPGEAFEPVNAREAARRFDLELCLVDKADPSQGRALEEALSGRSLVIQGPPGTGKSQTITNLIAAALDRGKTVLFVAEKLAALEVVRRRLREVGLGDFCLELHSHKTRKKAFFEDVAARLERKARGEPADYDRALRDLTEKRAALDAYAGAVGEPAGETGLTVADLLFESGRLKLDAFEVAAAVDRLDLPEALCRAVDPLSLDPSARAATATSLDSAARALTGLDDQGGPLASPWRGVAADSQAAYAPKSLLQALSLWRDAARLLAVPEPEVRDIETATRRSAEAADALQVLAVDWRTAHAAAEGASIALLEMRTVFELPLHGPTATMDALKVVALAGDAPLNSLAVAHPGLDAPGAETALHRLASALAERQVRIGALHGRVDDPEATGQQPETLRLAAKTLATTGFFGRFGREWRAARKLARRLCAAGGSQSPKAQAAALDALAQVAAADAAMAADPAYHMVAGPHFAGARTDVAGLMAVHAWRCAVEQAFSKPQQRPLRTLLTQSRPVDLKNLAAYAEGDLARFAELTTSLVGVGDDENLWRAATAAAPEVWSERLAAARSTVEVDAVLTHAASLSEAVRRWDDNRQTADDVFERLGAAGARLIARAEQRTQEIGALDLNAWFSGSRPAPAGIADRADAAFSAPERLEAWLAYDRARAAVAGPAALDVLAAVERGDIPRARAGDAWRIAWATGACQAALKRQPLLRRADHETLTQLREGYAELDEQVMILRRRRVAARLLERKPPRGVASSYVRQKTELALLEHSIGLERRHPAVRDVIGRAGRTLQCIKPCFMMGPLSVAQYFAPGKLAFDLVIMDEASQMRPEDAIGSVARGGQLVVVGDDMQLPPTAFFDRVAATDGDGGPEDDGPTAGQNDPSILSLAAASFGRANSPMLEWHYRSRHPELIAFSNHQFYRDKLLVFPAPQDADDQLGLTLVPVADGWAVEGLNDVEARAVAEGAVEHLRRRPDRSLGVVAMNVRQAERIEDHIARLVKTDAELGRALDRGEDDAARIEPFFVKNLENVQGDERDVIMISMTYGPREAGGRVPQNFGPINKDGGHRRLNVLFSRAKERMVVFSSMRSADIVAGPESPEGVRALQGFLSFAETKRLPSGARITGKPPESPFEEAVASQLERAGYAVEAQLGVESFRIDLAVRDPDAPERFLLGVECDGASYHSTLEARDRDRLREDVLKRLGWEIERVWSVDWFRDPAREMGRLLARLEALRASRPRPSPEPVPLTPLPEPSAAPPPSQPSLQPAFLHGALFDGPPLAAAATASPTPMHTPDELREKLVALRERIEAEHPDHDPGRGLLRPRMMDALIHHRPSDIEEFRATIAEAMRASTEGAQLKCYGEEMFDLLAGVP